MAINNEIFNISEVWKACNNNIFIKNSKKVERKFTLQPSPNVRPEQKIMSVFVPFIFILIRFLGSYG